MEEKRNVFLSKSFRILFWLGILGILVNFVTTEEIRSWMPMLQLPGQVLNICYLAVYGVVFMKMAAENERYQMVAGCQFVLIVFEVVTSLLGDDFVWMIISLLVTLGLTLYKEYNEFIGHAEVLAGMNKVLSDKWRMLWKWDVVILILMLIATVTAIMNAVIGTAGMLGSLVGMIVIGILKLMYLYRAAKVFGKAKN